MFSISYPFVLLLIPIILGLWYYFFREKYGFIYPNNIIANNLTNSNLLYTWIIRLFIIWMILLIIANIQYVHKETKKEIIPHDIIIVFDVSLSMLAEDMMPNRIETAKSVVTDFVSKRKHDRIGLIIFAGQPFVSIPFSRDYSGIKHIIQNMSPYLLRQDLPWVSGTNIGDAILLANMSFSGTENWEKSIVLITDWRSNVGIDPIIAAYDSKNANIHIYPIGIGSNSGGKLSYTNTYWEKIYLKDEKGNEIISDLDENGLLQIAKETWGQYFHAENKWNLNTVFSKIDEHLPEITTDVNITNTLSLNGIFYGILLILIILERSITIQNIRKYIPKYKSLIR